MDIAQLRATLVLEKGPFDASLGQAKQAMQQFASGGAGAAAPLKTALTGVTQATGSLKDGLQQANQALRQFASQAGASLGGLQNLVGPALTSGFVGLGAAALKSSLDVQGAMNTIRVAVGDSGPALAQMNESFQKVATTVPNDLGSVGQALAGFARLTGETGKPLENLATQGLNLSRILGTDLKATISDSARLFSQFGVSAGDETKTLNFLFRATQEGSTDFNTLEKSLVRFAPTLKGLGLPFADSVALLTSFNREGVNTDRAMMALNIGMTRWAKAGVTDARKAIGDLFGAIQRAPSATKALQIAVGAGLSARGATDVVNAVRSGATAYGDLVKRIQSGSDTIQKAAKQTETFGTGFGKLRNQVELALAPLGKGLGNALVGLGQNLKPLLDLVKGVGEQFAKLPGPVQLGAAAFAGLAPLVGPQLAAAIGIGVAAIDGLLSAWNNDWGHIRSTTERFLSWISPAVREVLEGVRDEAKRIWGEFREFITGFWSSLTETVVPLIAGFGKAVLDQFLLPFRALSALFDLLPQRAKDALGQWTQVLQAFKPETASLIVTTLGEAYRREHPEYGQPSPTSGSGARRGGRDTLSGTGDAPDLKGLTERQKEEQRATDLIAKNARILQFLHQGEKLDIARLAGEYRTLSASRLQDVFASQKAVDAAIQTATSQKSYTNDLTKLNAEIRRLTAGHKAEAGGLDALKEKYPGLTAEQYKVMAAAQQWKLHLEEVRKEVERVGAAIRSAAVQVMGTQTTSPAGAAAVQLFGEPFTRRFGPSSANRLWRNLTPEQRAQAQRLGGLESAAAIGGDVQRMGADANRLNYVSRTQQISLQYFGQTADRLGAPQLTQVHQYETLENRLQRVTAADQVYRAEQQRVNQVIGAAGPNLGVLQDQFRTFTGRSTAAREVLQQFGVHLEELPRQTQQALRAFLDLQKGMAFIQDLAGGLENVFSTAFANVSHGFKGFIQSITQGFEQMLQQMAAKYLASQLVGLLLNTFGGGLGGLFGGGGAGHRAAGGPISAGRPYLVGEYGPELIVPNRAGYVQPNAAAGAAPVVIHQHINISTPDANSFRQNKGAIMSDLGRAIDRARRTHG